MTIQDTSESPVYDGSSGSYAAALHALTHEGPGKRTVAFPVDGVSFSSRFDGGSLDNVSRVSGDKFIVTIPEDASESGISTGYTTWFYFEVLVDACAPQAERPESQHPENDSKKPGGSTKKTTGSMRELSLTLANMNNQRGLYANGYTVLHCVMDATRDDREDEDVELFFENERKWRRLATPLEVQTYTHTVHGSATCSSNDSEDGSGGDQPTTLSGVGPTKTETKMKLTFTHHVQFPRERVRFAFCYPYTYSKIQRLLGSISAAVGRASLSSVYFHRDVLTHSLGGLPIELFTVSSTDAMTEKFEPALPGLFPTLHGQRARSFDLTKKRTVFITARVHPGETPASFMLDGMLRLLLHATDEQASHLRHQFVFKIIPVLNPDGMCQGFYRTDSRGVNLNRVYEDPQLESEPAVHGIKALLLETVGRYGKEVARDRVVYLDLHAHSNHRGCFVYGNHLAPTQADGRQGRNWTRQVETQVFAKLSSLHSAFFDYGACSFDAQNMTRCDVRDNNNATTSRAGSSRVALFSATDLTYVYTIECNYNEGRRRLETTAQRQGPRPKAVEPTANAAGAAKHDRPSIQRHAAPLGGRLFIKYSPAEWMDVGMGCLLALLDLFQVAPARGVIGSSVLADSPYRTLEGVKKSILSDLKAMELAMGSSIPPPVKSSGSIKTLSIVKPGTQRNPQTPTSRSTLSKY
jgi:cytosolic carboxypeptidase protein 5